MVRGDLFQPNFKPSCPAWYCKRLGGGCPQPISEMRMGGMATLLLSHLPLGGSSSSNSVGSNTSIVFHTLECNLGSPGTDWKVILANPQPPQLQPHLHSTRE